MTEKIVASKMKGNPRKRDEVKGAQIDSVIPFNNRRAAIEQPGESRDDERER